MYRKTAKVKKYENMRAAKERKRLAQADPEPRSFWQPPKLRRIVIVIDFDFGIRYSIMKLFRCKRIDQYRAEADGKPWRDSVGFAAVLAAIRKSYPPVRVMD